MKRLSKEKLNIKRTKVVVIYILMLLVNLVNFGKLLICILIYTFFYKLCLFFECLAKSLN